MWESPKQLVELREFYEGMIQNPSSYSDDEVVSKIEESFWGTNCWCFVEQSLSIIAPACLMRPHLTERLIRHPIEGMIAGGLTDFQDVIPQGIALAKKEYPYVEPTEEGRQWLLHDWPKLTNETKKVFEELWQELIEDE
ncbi:hypothetical protein KCM76_23815 [Zooshikella marina]|uniref:hypothetical protein n=1 Tax=Zooshikella ganghwensis TaxID=202772 RepID=UPI001BAE60A7|nr:hypothetical protein [Zooshikella ganghwensis]MBU2709044.1 hypothetical protein [Zooshikella ganghwensis]